MNGPETLDALRSSKRILVLGPSGSGKTYLSLRLGELLELPVVHLDAWFWQPGWVSTPQPEWREVVAQLINANRWIMDGTYESTLDLRLPAADAVIVIERSRWLCLWNVVRRSLAHRNKTRPDAPPGQPLDRDYLRYIWSYRENVRGLVVDLIETHFVGQCNIVLSGGPAIRRLLGAMRSS